VYAEWEQQGHVPRELYRQLGGLGALGINLPTEFGGGGRHDYLYNVVLQEEAARALVTLGTLRSHLDWSSRTSWTTPTRSSNGAGFPAS
jgi:acyl-CoA dehydrogenase